MPNMVCCNQNSTYIHGMLIFYGCLLMVPPDKAHLVDLTVGGPCIGSWTVSEPRIDNLSG